VETMESRGGAKPRAEGRHIWSILRLIGVQPAGHTCEPASTSNPSEEATADSTPLLHWWPTSEPGRKPSARSRVGKIGREPAVRLVWFGLSQKETPRKKNRPSFCRTATLTRDCSDALDKALQLGDIPRRHAMRVVAGQNLEQAASTLGCIPTKTNARP